LKLLAIVPTILFPILVGYSMNIGVLAALEVTASTNKSNYDIREPVTLYGDIASSGSPVSNALVSLDIYSLRGRNFAFRTLSLGNPNPTAIFGLTNWPLSVADVYAVDSHGDRVDNATLDASITIAATVRNNYYNDAACIIAVTLYDKSFISVYAAVSSCTIRGGTNSTVFWPYQIPQWMTPGGAMLFCSVFDFLPRDGGTARCPEGVALLHILRNSGADYAYSQIQTAYTTVPGGYSAILRSTPDSPPGLYDATVTARASLTSMGYGETQFNVQYNPCPPQAAFTNYPLATYVSMAVTFDASSSSAEGFGSAITGYEWQINDPYNMSHTTGSNRKTSHTFQHVGVYTVELNVTDNNGLWSTTSKPITIQPEHGPTASFIWDLPVVLRNWTVNFDASNSSSGWSVQLGDFSPIMNYTWNFGDGTAPMTATNPTIGHKFMQQDHFSVQLNVTDSVGRTDTTAKILEVTGPDLTANFICTLGLNLTVQFDASGSTPGWSNELNDYSPIVSYTWDFGDGTPATPIPDPIVGHNFTQAGNYTVQLTVMDSVGRTNTTHATVQVRNLQYPIWDINQDGKCNILDVSAVAKLFGQNVPPAPAYADIAGPHGVPDGKVNILDVSLVAKHFGENYNW